MSDSLATNKVMAAVLVCGIVFMVTGMVANGIVNPGKLDHTAIKIDVQEAPAATSGPVEAALDPIGPYLAKADPAAGAKDMTRQCAVCHDWSPGGPAKVGPNLYNVIGGPHAHMAGFNYSSGLAAIKGPWTFEELNAWLHNPRSVVSGTRMSFAGIDSEKERADVIDYLRTLSANPEPLPTDSPAAAPPTSAAGQQTPTEKAAGAPNSSIAPQAAPSANPAGH